MGMNRSLSLARAEQRNIGGLQTLVPDRLAELCQNVAAGEMSREDYVCEQERLLEPYRVEWKKALLCDGETDLRASLLKEVAAYYHDSNLTDIDRSCDLAVDTLKSEWERTVDSRQRSSIERFYETEAHIYDLINWHTLRDDSGPLAYVLALQIARSHNIRNCLDFGSGVGSGGLLFCRADIDTTLADISTTLLDFAQWRFDRRRVRGRFVDLKDMPLPEGRFDMILAMDVFEHLVDPVEVVKQLWCAMKPGGLLFARIHAEMSPSHPQHIVEDFGPTFTRMEELGFVETWRDRTLWGHLLFQKCDSPL
jgi:2-polyprenyl-3-methyl-5-hydroxy-6-metoxy-1,4-benzoquinol methylase